MLLKNKFYITIYFYFIFGNICKNLTMMQIFFFISLWVAKIIDCAPRYIWNTVQLRLHYNTIPHLASVWVPFPTLETMSSVSPGSQIIVHAAKPHYLWLSATPQREHITTANYHRRGS